MVSLLISLTSFRFISTFAKGVVSLLISSFLNVLDLSLFHSKLFSNESRTVLFCFLIVIITCVFVFEMLMPIHVPFFFSADYVILMKYDKWILTINWNLVQILEDNFNDFVQKRIKYFVYIMFVVLL